jgi:small subunit ribosomal protein S17
MSKRQLTGIIISNKTPKTVVVKVERTKEHPRYKRRYKAHKHYKAHLEKGEYQLGDKVVIEECRPMSKEKKWRVVKKITSHIGEGSGEPESSPVKEKIKSRGFLKSEPESSESERQLKAGEGERPTG